MNARNFSMAIAAISLAVLPVAAQAGTSASSVSSVGMQSSATVEQPNEVRVKNYVLLYLLGAITLAALIAVVSSGSKKCQSRGAVVPCS